MHTFVSYRSQAVAAVRPLAERAMAAGASLWMDEYGIRTRHYARLDEEIKAAIAASTQAIIFASPDYVGREWCELELDRLLGRLSPSQVLVVDLGEGALVRRRHPRLPWCAAAATQAETYRRIQEAGFFPALQAPPQADGPDRRPHEVKEAALLLDVSGWVLDPVSLLRAQDWRDRLSHNDQPRSEYARWTTRDGQIRLDVEYGQLAPEHARLVRQALETDDEGPSRARLEKELLSFEEEALYVLTEQLRAVGGTRGGHRPAASIQDIEEIGVHLHGSTIGGRTYKHRLFTFHVPHLHASFRVYKLAFLHPVLRDTPFVVRLVFRVAGGRQELLRCLPICDRVGQSFRLSSDVAAGPDDLRRVAGKRRRESPKEFW